jgi:hypothetical protein
LLFKISSSSIGSSEYDGSGNFPYCELDIAKLGAASTVPFLVN